MEIQWRSCPWWGESGPAQDPLFVPCRSSWKRGRWAHKRRAQPSRDQPAVYRSSRFLVPFLGATSSSTGAAQPSAFNPPSFVPAQSGDALVAVASMSVILCTGKIPSIVTSTCSARRSVADTCDCDSWLRPHNQVLALLPIVLLNSLPATIVLTRLSGFGRLSLEYAPAPSSIPTLRSTACAFPPTSDSLPPRATTQSSCSTSAPRTQLLPLSLRAIQATSLA